jgi:MFS transporter, YQGE family, putative transporter
MKLFNSKKLVSEYMFFLTMPWNMRVLLMTNMIYAFVLPVIEIFVGAYIMRNSNDPKIVALYQLTVYTGIPFTFLINGYLLNKVKVTTLYSAGMLLSGLSMLLMMNLHGLSYLGVGLAGILMGCSFGLFWANRDFLALNTRTIRTGITIMAWRHSFTPLQPLLFLLSWALFLPIHFYTTGSMVTLEGLIR